MNKKYDIAWRDAKQNVLQITFLIDITWQDILDANLEAVKIIDSISQNVVLFNSSPQTFVDNVNIGVIKSMLFSGLPEAPKNLKGVIILVPSAQKIMLEMGIESIANVYYGRKFMRVTDNLETANKLIEEKLRG